MYRDDFQETGSSIFLSLNLLAVPTSEVGASLTPPSKTNTLLFPSSSPGALRRRKETNGSDFSNPNQAVLCLTVVEGRNFCDLPEFHTQEVYLKFR